jgi:ATPase subunit of ABC transporter with duplicated ATPase domains
VDVSNKFARTSPQSKEEIAIIEKVRSEDLQIRQEIAAELLKTLCFEYIFERYEAVDESHKKTFDWIFQLPESSAQYSEGKRWADFPKWLQSGKGIYWINGKAGSGKSTLMKYIVRHQETKRYL